MLIKFSKIRSKQSEIFVEDKHHTHYLYNNFRLKLFNVYDCLQGYMLIICTILCTNMPPGG